MDDNRRTNMILQQVRRRYRPEEIRELKSEGDCCLLRLRSGELFLARLDRSMALVLEELDGVC